MRAATVPSRSARRGEIIAHMEAALLGAHQHCRVHREIYAGTTFTSEPRRYAPKIGLNVPVRRGRSTGGAAEGGR